jgi:hypothetical protein
MVLAHPELESWHKVAIRNALRDYLIGVIFVPLYEEEDEGDPPILKPLDPSKITSFRNIVRSIADRPRGWGNLDEEMEVQVAQDADVDEKLLNIIDGVRYIIGISE